MKTPPLPFSINGPLLALGLLASSTAWSADFEFHQRLPGIKAKAPVVTEGSSCAAILQASPSAKSGIYTLNISESESYPVFCDMETAEGGWMLVLNYLHKAGTNPPLAILNDRFPHMKGTTLGLDESGDSEAWGHLSPALFAKLAPVEVRFQCETSGHDRKIHFKTSDPSVISYFGSGQGNFANPAGATTTLLSGHSAFTPLSANSGGYSIARNNGNYAMTEHLFFQANNYHWNVRSNHSPATYDYRWDCDDFIKGQPNDTLHRIWVR